jgi:hypothetical protein
MALRQESTNPHQSTRINRTMARFGQTAMVLLAERLIKAPQLLFPSCSLVFIGG